MKTSRDDLAIGDGWLPLVEPLIKTLEAAGGTVFQVKEKFGGLRFYYNKPTEGPRADDKAFWWLFDRAVELAESRAWRTCEFSGKPGKTYSVKADGSPTWQLTLSPEEALKRGYRLE